VVDFNIAFCSVHLRM